MTNPEVVGIQKAMRTFMRNPSPERADILLLLMAPHRRESTTIQRLIDQVLDYKYIVGSLSKQEEAAVAG